MSNIYTLLQVHAVSSYQEWLTMAQKWVDNQNVSLFTRNLPTISLHPSLTPPRLSPRVEWNKWKVACAHCDNWPAYSPEWRAAICYECGTIYLNLDVQGDPAAIDVAMGVYTRIPERNWQP